jgi:hypothetical protein
MLQEKCPSESVLAETEKKARDLLRMSQRVKQVRCTHNLKEHESNMLPAMDNALEQAATLVIEVGGMAHGRILVRIKDSMKALSSMIEASASIPAWKLALDSVDTIEQAALKFKEGFVDFKAADAKHASACLDKLLLQATQKLLEYGLEKTEQPDTDAKDILKTTREHLMEYDLMSAFADPKIRADKSALRAKMSSVQSDMRQQQITPDSLSPVLLDAYRLALKGRL